MKFIYYKTYGSTICRDMRALGYSDPSAVRALVRARGSLALWTVDPVGQRISRTYVLSFLGTA